MKRPKVLILFSGGLDSILAAKILMDQGMKVTGLSFKSYFFDSEHAQKAVQNLGMELKVVDISKEHLQIVKYPKYGYGSSMNPCLDCHILMLHKAKEIMVKGKFDFVATGEVLGERPMSQNKIALGIVEKESSLKGYLLRPLSAKKLEPTVPEKEQIVDRQKLLDISGRSRKRQLKLAKKWKISWYPTPAGGCLLTDSGFGKRLKTLFQKHPKCDEKDIELLKYGRHFWKNNIVMIVGRKYRENLKIKKLAKRKDVLIEMENYPGPTTLICNHSKRIKIPKITLEKAKSLTQHYSTKARHKKDVKFKIYSK